MSLLYFIPVMGMPVNTIYNLLDQWYYDVDLAQWTEA